MVEGITTRVQKELTALQTTTENITIEMRSNHEKLRLETQLYSDGKFMEAQAYADARHEEVTAKINQVLYLLNGKQKVDSGQHSGNDGSQTMVNTRFPTKLSKIECPRFNGTHFKGWWLKIEQFFCAEQTPEREKVRLVMMHLEGKALQWPQRFMKNKGSITEVPWISYFADMRSRFCDTEFKDPMFELVSLKQTGSVDDYYDEFEFLVNLLDFSDEYALSIFLSNLKQEIARPVRLFFPKTITHAYNLAKQLDMMIFNTSPRPNTTSKSQTQTLPLTTSHNQQPKPDLPPLLPTPRSFFNPQSSYQRPQQRQFTKPEPQKGLCIWCATKYTMGHKCVRSQLYQLLVDETDDQEEFVDCVESLEML